ncbi:MAG: signal peptidase I [Acidobacteria bacterium]|nr:MAG: signal peptidase I [Acidobacteriota bacterium]
MNGATMGLIVLDVALIILMVAAMWTVFKKAGEPGWAALIPIYNIMVLLKIAGKPMWWVILMLIPFVNIIVLIIAIVGLARNFGKGAGFALGLVFLAPIFYPILAWGDAQYQPQAA